MNLPLSGVSCMHRWKQLLFPYMHHKYLNKPISKDIISVQNESNVYMIYNLYLYWFN